MGITRRGLISVLKRFKFLPQKLYVKVYYEYYSKKKLDYSKPIEFNQKISWYKVFYKNKLLNQLVDKYSVREFVKMKIGGEYLNELYGVYYKISELDFKNLPSKFVIKAAHGYGYNLIVKNNEKLNKFETKLKMCKWMLKNQYYRGGKEWAYKDVKPKLIAEKFMEEEGRESLTDYKFYCFNGEVKFCKVHLDRAVNYHSGFYDLSFEKLPFRNTPKSQSYSYEIEKPENYDEMIKIAGKLSENIPFVRVDLYSINGKTVFGEMTFYPADGRLEFYPKEYNKIIGDYFVLPQGIS